MKPRFQADSDLRDAIRLGVLRREPSIDFTSALTAKLAAKPDPEVLRLCAEDNRILISHDENSMPSHFRSFLAAGNSSPGVLIAAQDCPIGAVISILLIWIASESHEWCDRLVWLPV